jgi:hypothetical protein
VLLAAARRFVVLVAGATALTVVLSLPVGLLLGSSVNRSVSLGLYLVGCFLLVGGFFYGNRGPVRLRNEEALVGLRRHRRITPANLEEQVESINSSALLVLTGLVLLALAIGIDSRHELV